MHAFGTDPKLADTDGDGLGDKIEIWTHTDPANRYSDGDGMSDGFEVAVGDHPRVKDLNGDPVDRQQSSEDLVVRMEQQLGVTQHNVDSDGDGFADWVEEINGGGDPKVNDMNENMVQPNPTALDRFMEVAEQQVGVKYQFGAEADIDGRHPRGVRFLRARGVEPRTRPGSRLPDGSWNQYRTLHEQGATISVDHALKTRARWCSASLPIRSHRPIGPRAPTSASASATARCSTCSERAGEVGRSTGHFYTHAALIPDLIDDLPTGPAHPPLYDMLHPSSPLHRDSDGDGMLDVDERALERDPFDPSDGTETTTTPGDDGTPQDGPITSPSCQVDPMLSAGGVGLRYEPERRCGHGRHARHHR